MAVYSNACKVSVVIPTRNEEITIADIIKGVKPFVDEILIVDGHSTDRTREIAKSEGARICLDNGKGKGDGLRVAIQEVTGDIIVFIDADGSHDTNDIPELIQPILENKSDMVIGSRARGGSDELHGDIDKLMRAIGSHTILVGINMRWKSNLTDCQNGFRAIRTSIARRLNLKENTFAIEEEMVMKCLKNGFIISEVPSHEYERLHGTSNLSLKKEWFRIVYCWLKNMLF
jgi:dolichol-phosphate mannosyltransferase